MVATCKRFTRLCKGSSEVKGSQTLSAEELQQAIRCVVRMEQIRVYGREIAALRKIQMMEKSSDLGRLSPWLDEFGLLRVGGRLRNAEVQYTVKHPWILPHLNPSSQS